MALERYGVVNDMMTVLHPASTGIPCNQSDVCDLATELENNYHITTINFSGIHIGTEAAIALGRAVGGGTRSTIQYIKFCGCGMTAEAIEGFTRHARGNRRLEIFDVSRNSLRDEGALHLAKFVEETPTVRVLEASECKIGPLGANALAGCVAAHKKMTTLNLSNNKLREAGVTAICKGLTENASVTVLDLGGNSINCEGGLALAEMLRKNKTIESVNLRNNFISDSIPQVAFALSQRGVPARVVDLSRNRITNTICRNMSNLLEGQRFNIACLAVEGNLIQDDGFVALFHALRGTNVQFLDMSDCMLTAASGVVIADLIRACPILNSLQIDNNALGDNALSEIAKAFASSTSMASINLERTQISGAGCAAMADAIAAQRKLRSINVAENHNLSAADVRGLLDAISRIRTCERIDLSDLNLADSEDLLRSLLAVFAANEHLEKIFLQHNPMAAGFPDGAMTRQFALQLADGASLQSFLSCTHGDVTIAATNGAKNSSAISNTNPTGNASALNHSVQSFRSAWATTRPMEHKTSVVAVARDDVDCTAEDGRVPPLIPHPQSLHHTMYPGYGIGRLSSSTYISTLSNPVPYTVGNSKGHPLPLVLSADQKSMLQYPPSRPLRQSPYSLMSLELNVGGLLITDDQLRRKFKELDIDGEGYLNRAEFKKAYLSYQSYGRPVTERELNEWMKNLDVGHGDRLFYDEFAILMLKLAQR